MPLLEQDRAGRAGRLSARVLVVEDDPVFRRFVLAALQETRFVAAQTDTAGSLAEAEQALSSGSYDCILLDLGLPDSQGIDTVRSALEKAPAVPIVVLTGEEDEEIADHALREGAQDFLEKAQLEPRTLGRAIRHAVDRGRWAAAMAKSNRELERRNSDLDDFAHAVSHDLKAPLRAIFNLVYEARDQLAAKDPAGVQQTLAAIEPKIRRLFDMIDGVLRLTQAGRRSSAVSVDVGLLVHEIRDSLDLPAGFEIRVAPGMPTILGEKTALGQVLQNLIDNAIKHHPGPPGLVEVGWRDLGTAFEFSVADDGAGIPPEQRERVFELFHTIGAHREGSTGIGLALVRKVVEANGGAIRVEDNPPRGAAFRFTWPKRPA
ncbi:MAG TPA: ATP-binding protein [Candidatus Thermoplasmatota archaeon]|nr:ATP-binding protein [Candidatus Thermoplasmatota archaeon]